MQATRIMITGGGTGGHIFPAVSIANALRKLEPACEILFVGAEGKMEMEKVPASGYEIVGLNISGFQRGSILKNLSLPFKVIGSVIKARKLIQSFKPNVVVGVGGYASGPLMYACSNMDIPYLIQEQNSFAGVTNKMLAKGASKICVAFDGMEKFFPSEKILKTGNPVRDNVIDIKDKRFAGAALLKLDPHKKTILVTGGSLGSATLNKSVEKYLDMLVSQDIQVIWQTGKYYYESIMQRLGVPPKGVIVMEFLHKMDLAYAAADVIVSRAGAGTIAELCFLSKPVILVPSPNVAEDHQTMNAIALVKNDAALLVKDTEAEDALMPLALNLLKDTVKMENLSKNINKMAMPNADIIIAKEVLKLAGK